MDSENDLFGGNISRVKSNGRTDCIESRGKCHCQFVMMTAISMRSKTLNRLVRIFYDSIPNRIYIPNVESFERDLAIRLREYKPLAFLVTESVWVRCSLNIWYWSGAVLRFASLKKPFTIYIETMHSQQKNDCNWNYIKYARELEQSYRVQSEQAVPVPCVQCYSMQWHCLAKRWKCARWSFVLYSIKDSRCSLYSLRFFSSHLQRGGAGTYRIGFHSGRSSR